MKNDRSVEEGIEIVDDYLSPRLKRIVLKKEELQQITSAVKAVDLEALETLLNFGGVLGTTSKQKIQREINTLPQKTKLDLVEYLWSNLEPGNVQVLGMIIRSLKMWEIHPSQFYEILTDLAMRKEWYIREIGAEVLGEALLSHESHLDKLQQYVNSNDIMLRRLAALSVRSMTRGPSERFNLVLQIIQPLMADDDPYISDVFVSTTIADRFLKWYPEQTLNWLNSMTESDNSSIRKNILQSFLQNIDADLAPVALDFVEKFLTDDRKEVRRASELVLTQICKIKEDMVSSWLESHIGSPHAVEHWANLSASGALKSGEFLF